MNSGYWRYCELEAEERGSHCVNRRVWREPASDFRFPAEGLADVLAEIFQARGALIDAADLQWLAQLLAELFRSEGGKMIEGYLALPPQVSEYREACERLLKVLRVIDVLMMRATEPARVWQEISLAIGLPSTHYLELTEKKVGEQFGISKMAVSKMVKKIIKLAELKPRTRGYNGSV
jgi:hypothetical protein